VLSKLLFGESYAVYGLFLLDAHSIMEGARGLWGFDLVEDLFSSVEFNFGLKERLVIRVRE
jgi:hypothetical protein